MADLTQEALQKAWQRKMAARPELLEALKKLSGKSASYPDAEQYAYEVGAALAEVFGELITTDAIPGGSFTMELARELIGALLEEDYRLVSKTAMQLQAFLNERAGLHLAVKKPELNRDRITVLLQKIAEADKLEDAAWLLDEPVKNFSQSIVDDCIKKNAEFHYRAGLQAKIIRKAEPKCCEWCSRLAGEYDYPNVPAEVYQRHERCRCIVNYYPSRLSREHQNVHTKRWS